MITPLKQVKIVVIHINIDFTVYVELKSEQVMNTIFFINWNITQYVTISLNQWYSTFCTRDLFLKPSKYPRAPTPLTLAVSHKKHTRKIQEKGHTNFSERIHTDTTLPHIYQTYSPFTTHYPSTTVQYTITLPRTTPHHTTLGYHKY